MSNGLIAFWDFQEPAGRPRRPLGGGDLGGLAVFDRALEDEALARLADPQLARGFLRVASSG